MLIVDSQVHIWESGTPVSHPPPGLRATRRTSCCATWTRPASARSLLHPPSWDPRANEVAIDAARQHPDRLAILGFFDVSRPENRSLVDTWKQQPGMLGLRFAFLRPGEENWLVDGTADWLWPAAERAGLPIGLLAPNRREGRRRDRREASAAEAAGRSHGAPARQPGRRGIRRSAAICSRSRNIPTSRSRRPARRATRAIPGRTATSTST